MRSSSVSEPSRGCIFFAGRVIRHNLVVINEDAKCSADYLQGLVILLYK